MRTTPSTGSSLGVALAMRLYAEQWPKRIPTYATRGGQNPGISRENQTHISFLVKLGHDILALDCTLAGDHKGNRWYPQQVDRARSKETNASFVLLLVCEEGQQRLQEALLVLRNCSKGRFQVVFRCE